MMIKNYTNFLFAFFSVFLLVSCIATKEMPVLSKEEKSKIQSTRILLNTTQREIVMQHNNWLNSELPHPDAPMDSGAIVKQHPPITRNNNQNIIVDLIVLGISHVRSKNALHSIAPIRETLEDFNFIAYFNKQLRHHVAKLPWLKVKKLEIKYNLLEPEADIVASANEDNTLFIGTTYALNSVFEKLEVIAYVKLWRKPTADQKEHLLYENNFNFIYRLPDAKKNNTENKKRWIKDNGALLKEKLRDAATLLSEMIAMDIDNTSLVNRFASNKLIVFRNKYGISSKGRLIKRKDNYFIIGHNSLLHQELYAVSSNNILES